MQNHGGSNQKRPNLVRTTSNAEPESERVREEGRREGYAQAIRKQRTVGRAQGLTVAHHLITLMTIQQWAEVKRDEPWLDEGLRWEEWAPLNLGYSDTYIDGMIKSVHKIGPENYEALQDIDVSRSDIIALRRAIEHGRVRVEGRILISGKDRIDLSQHPDQVCDLINKLKEEKRIAKEEATRAQEALTEHQALARKEIKRHHEIVEAKDAKIKALEARPVPIHGATEADRQRYPQVQAQFHEIDFACDRLEAINEEDGHSRGFWRELRHTVTRIRDRLCDLERAVADAHPDSYDSVWPYVPDPATELPAAAQAERMLREAVDTDGAGA